MNIFKSKRKVDLFVLPPAGEPGSGKFCWWTVRDHIGEIRDNYFMPNVVLAYYFAGLPNAQQLAEAQCERFKQGIDKIPESPLSFGGPRALSA